MKYHVSYDIKAHKEGRPADEIMEGDRGGCDAIILHSILFPEDGSYSHVLISLDGRTGRPLDSMEIFKAWTMMAHEIAAREDLEPGRRALAVNVQAAMTEHVLKQRGVPTFREWFEAAKEAHLAMATESAGARIDAMKKLQDLCIRYCAVFPPEPARG
jgi:hypothetical protein